MVALVLGGCSDDADSGSLGEPSVEATSGNVSGVYDTEVRLVKNTCAGIEVMDNDTTVQQADGTDTITLTHAGTTWNGLLDHDDLTFGTHPLDVQVGADTHQLQVVGIFDGKGGMEAQVTAIVRGGQTCRYEVSWTGTRQ